MNLYFALIETCHISKFDIGFMNHIEDLLLSQKLLINIWATVFCTWSHWGRSSKEGSNEKNWNNICQDCWKSQLDLIIADVLIADFDIFVLQFKNFLKTVWICSKIDKVSLVVLIKENFVDWLTLRYINFDMKFIELAGVSGNLVLQIVNGVLFSLFFSWQEV